MTFLDFFKRVPDTPISLRIFKKEFQIRSGDRRIVFDEEYHVPSCPLHLPPKVVITDAAASAVRMRPLQSASVNKGFSVLTSARADGTMVARDEEGSAQWSLNAMTQAAQEAGIQIKRSQIRRIYLREGVRWRRTHSWGESSDPDFVSKEPRSSATTPSRPRGRRPSAATNSGQ